MARNGRSSLGREMAARAWPGAAAGSKWPSKNASRTRSETAKFLIGALRAEVQNARRELPEPALAPQHVPKVPFAPTAATCVRCLRLKWALEECCLLFVHSRHHFFSAPPCFVHGMHGFTLVFFLHIHVMCNQGDTSTNYQVSVRGPLNRARLDLCWLSATYTRFAYGSLQCL